MPTEDAFEWVTERTLVHEERESLTPAEYRDLKAAVFAEPFRRLVYSDVSYFVLGNYDDGPREARLERVVDRLNDREGAYAFLMKDVPDPWEFWTTKFKILADRATYLVPVLEDSHGSHHWEAGQIDRPAYRPKVHVCKRDYPTETAERDHFGAMVAHFVEILDRDGRVYHWTGPDDLDDAVAELPE